MACMKNEAGDMKKAPDKLKDRQLGKRYKNMMEELHTFQYMRQ